MDTSPNDNLGNVGQLVTLLKEYLRNNWRFEGGNTYAPPPRAAPGYPSTNDSPAVSATAVNAASDGKQERLDDLVKQISVRATSLREIGIERIGRDDFAKIVGFTLYRGNDTARIALAQAKRLHEILATEPAADGKTREGELLSVTQFADLSRMDKADVSKLDKALLTVAKAKLERAKRDGRRTRREDSRTASAIGTIKTPQPKAKPVAKGKSFWRCRGCGRTYPDSPDLECSKCGPSAEFEPIVPR